MPSIHGHEVLQMMISSGESYTVATLEAAIIARFGKEARFHTCSAENLSAAELVAFLQKKGKFIAVDEGGNDSNLLIVFYVQIMPDDLVMQLHRF
ncbi:YecH family metal-binding protein [Klebsiella grimontii]|uniref:YecH family metal-binding protein n=1 Tax=Klebsiella grimontii TaxID=2058152 RepID=UPI001E46AD5F|nr:YecH family metal-binding protein [Klebsiella grimontii]